MFIGRERELNELRGIVHSKKWAVGIVYGARRIGKSKLIDEATKNCFRLSYLSSDTSLKDNLNRFSRSLCSILDYPDATVFPSFDYALDLIIDKLNGKSFVLFIDELPFLYKVCPSIINSLQRFIDRLHDTDIKLILSGSDMSFMQDIVENKAKPLYQRQSFVLRLEPMTYSDSLKFLKGMSPIDKIECLSLFIGRPLYLEMIDTSLSFEANLKRLAFSITSPLLSAPSIVLPIGVNDSGIYKLILKAIANGKNKQTEIASYIGEPVTNVSTYITKLVNSNLIIRNESFKGNSRTNYYTISDPFLTFYYAIIDEYKEMIMQGYGDVIFDNIKEKLRYHVSKGFETVVNNYVNELNVSGKLNSVYGPIRNFKADNTILGRSIEVDGLAESLFDKGKLLVIEAKFRDKDVSMEVLEHLKESVSIFPKFNDYEFYLFSKKGFSRELLENKGNNVHLISIKEMVS